MEPESLDPVFAALSDATRRAVMELLAGAGGVTATQLSSRFTVTRQAVTKHLQVLAGAGLVVSRRQGRETFWSLTPAPLAPAVAWMNDLDGDFGDRLSDLQRHLAERNQGRGFPPGPPLRIAAALPPARRPESPPPSGDAGRVGDPPD